MTDKKKMPRIECMQYTTETYEREEGNWSIRKVGEPHKIDVDAAVEDWLFDYFSRFEGWEQILLHGEGLKFSVKNQDGNKEWFLAHPPEPIVSYDIHEKQDSCDPDDDDPSPWGRRGFRSDVFRSRRAEAKNLMAQARKLLAFSREDGEMIHGIVLEHHEGGNIVSAKNPSRSIARGQLVESNGSFGPEARRKGIVIDILEPFTKGRSTDIFSVHFEGEEYPRFMKFKDLI